MFIAHTAGVARWSRDQQRLEPIYGARAVQFIAADAAGNAYAPTGGSLMKWTVPQLRPFPPSPSPPSPLPPPLPPFPPTPPPAADAYPCTQGAERDRVATGNWGETLQLDCGSDVIQISCVYHGWREKACMDPPDQISQVRGLCEYRNNCTVLAKVDTMANRGIGQLDTCCNNELDGVPTRQSCPSPAPPPSAIRYR